MGAGYGVVKWNRVLIDVCTQRDFLESGAILQVADLDKLIPHLQAVFCWAESARIPIVSSVESHRPAEPFNGFPLHCIDGTPGQQKLSFTLLSPWVMVENDNYLSLPPDLQKEYRQLIFRKRTREVLSNPKTDRFLTQLDTEEMIICGVGLERPIKALALGLLARHKSVTVITDACGYWSLGDADLALRQLAAKRVRLVKTARLTARDGRPKGTLARRRRLRYRHHPAKATPARQTRTGVAKQA